MLVKHENHTPVGAFKIRGGLTYFDASRRQGALPREVMSATLGNHGQSIGWAARTHGVPCTIVVSGATRSRRTRPCARWCASAVSGATAQPLRSPDNGRMGTLYLVRHGQASFGTENYDQLSSLGQQQSVRLGEYFAHKGLKFEAALTGTLVRHAQTYAGIRQGAGLDLEPQAWPGLNEYDSAAVIAAIHPQSLEKPDTPELYRQHFRLLRDGLTQWMNGVVSPRGMPNYTDFVTGVSSALDHVRKNFEGSVLLVSSGGPIATAVGQVLGTTPETTIEMNLRIRNSAVTEFVFNPKRFSLLTFNALPHLDAARYADWLTYA